MHIICAFVYAPLREDCVEIKYLIIVFGCVLCQVSLLNSQQNMVGWDGHSAITAEGEVYFNDSCI